MKKEYKFNAEKEITLQGLFIIGIIILLLTNVHIGEKEKTNVMIIESEFSTKYKYYGGSVDIQCNEEIFFCSPHEYNAFGCNENLFWTYKISRYTGEPNGIWIIKGGLICKITQVYQGYGWKT